MQTELRILGHLIFYSIIVTSVTRNGDNYILAQGPFGSHCSKSHGCSLINPTLLDFYSKLNSSIKSIIMFIQKYVNHIHKEANHAISEKKEKL